MAKDLDMWYVRNCEFDKIELLSSRWCLLIYSIVGLIADVAIVIHKDCDFEVYKNPSSIIDKIKHNILKDYPNATIKSISFTSSFEYSHIVIK